MQGQFRDYLNFLSHAAFESFNLRPDANGQVTLKVNDYQSYSNISVAAYNNDSFVSREIDIQQHLKAGDHGTLPPIPKRELTRMTEQVSDSCGQIETRAT